MENRLELKATGFGGRLKSMLKVDFRRAARSKLIYIVITTLNSR